MKKNDLIWYAMTLLGAAALMGAMVCMFTGRFDFMFFGFVSITLLGLRDWVSAADRNQQRQQQMQALAGELGFSFQAHAPVNFLKLSKSFLLIRPSVEALETVEQMTMLKWLLPYLASVRNVMTREIEDLVLTVFDFQYADRHQEDRSRLQTVFALKSPELTCPHFALTVATGRDGIKSKFRNDVVIRDGLRLVTDHPSIASTVPEELFDLLDGTTCLEAGEGFLLLYRPDQLATPPEIELKIKAALGIHSVLADSPITGQSTASAGA